MELSEKLEQMILADQLDEAIELAEIELSKQPMTEFHRIIDCSFLALKQALISFIDNFFTLAKQKIVVKAIYVEMNGFTINTDVWYLEPFAFNQSGDLSDTDWLADYDFYDGNVLTLGGFEKLQAAFQEYLDKEKWKEEGAEHTRELCEFLIILRLQQLFRESKVTAREQNMSWANIPIFVTAHDYDLIYQAS